MEREIKFRCWYLEKGMIDLDCNYVVLDGGYEIPTIDIIYGHASGFKVMQYTGLKDKNGVECFEFDVVDTEIGRGKVIFHCGCFMIEWIDDPEANMELLGIKNKYGRPREFEVIGNIYETPELLTK